MMTTIENLKVDAYQIAKGLYAMIEQREEQAIVAFGMIPLWILELFEKNLREKILSIEAARLEVMPSDLEPYINEESIKKIISKISHQVSVNIYKVASEKGAMLV